MNVFQENYIDGRKVIEKMQNYILLTVCENSLLSIFSLLDNSYVKNITIATDQQHLHKIYYPLQFFSLNSELYHYFFQSDNSKKKSLNKNFNIKKQNDWQQEYFYVNFNDDFFNLSFKEQFKTMKDIEKKFIESRKIVSLCPKKKFFEDGISQFLNKIQNLTIKPFIITKDNYQEFINKALINQWGDEREAYINQQAIERQLSKQPDYKHNLSKNKI